MRIFGRELSFQITSCRFYSVALLAAVAGVVVVFVGAEFSLDTRAGTMSEKDRIAAVEQSIKDPANSTHLANFHHQKQMSCTTCHGSELIPDANATAINGQCIACHGGFERVATTHKGPPWLNPHASHLGNVACTACHAAHQEAKAYCTNCHTNFKMPMQAGAATAKPK
jgi:DnaJ-class molecular chaperone